MDQKRFPSLYDVWWGLLVVAVSPASSKCLCYFIDAVITGKKITSDEIVLNPDMYIHYVFDLWVKRHDSNTRKLVAKTRNNVFGDHMQNLQLHKIKASHRATSCSEHHGCGHTTIQIYHHIRSFIFGSANKLQHALLGHVTSIKTSLYCLQILAYTNLYKPHNTWQTWWK